MTVMSSKAFLSEAVFMCQRGVVPRASLKCRFSF